MSQPEPHIVGYDTLAMHCYLASRHYAGGCTVLLNSHGQSQSAILAEGRRHAENGRMYVSFQPAAGSQPAAGIRH